ncbi:KAP family P-loop NTPase fold protein [Pseudothioclava arenosa]|uniref:KAP NTPase domain-containing protein n=1 Tax=Pseudothioclava arenosa TaxID=1795308 RepID=A0A2A4CNE0_9RHOB|nr:P-loop NTPase fold protein [Pseudothioclava arenosa]PCD75646.1 hypothetical protein CLN94_12900 [Pseudothioclava arenosa]
MRLTLPEPDIDIGIDTFESDKALDWLERTSFGERLSKLVEAIDDPTVIALDGAWGSGKSHFLKLWAGAHEHQFNHKARVVYFDAFKEDFLDDPLISLVAALAPAKEDDSKISKATTKLKRLAIPLAKGAARVGLAAASYGATAAVEGVWDALAEATSDELGKGVAAIDKLWARETTKRAAMDAFVATLREATQPETDGGPLNKLVIIVDELDRCRPDYALSLLETIKHFFAVDGVHFVLGVNLGELENSVKARYGAGCDARSYLQKFVTLRLRLPQTPGEPFVRPSDPEIFAETLCKKLELPANLTRHFAFLVSERNKAAPLSFREIERFATRAALMAPFLRPEKDMRLLAVLTICMIEVTAPDVSAQLRRGQLENRPLSAFFGLASDGSGFDGGQFASLLAMLEGLEPIAPDFDRRFIGSDMIPHIYENYIDAWGSI